MSLKPNIFEIATKELSQDAFLTWLLRWADDSHNLHDKALNLCAKEFVQRLIAKQKHELQIPINKVKAIRQRHNIDIWVEVNDKILIIIEDKTSSQKHGNQLNVYREIAENWCSEKNFHPIYIYLKTGNESNSSLDSVKKDGFAIFGRMDLLNLFKAHTEIKNDIFLDFYNRLINLENSNNKYNDINIGDWRGEVWTGFYQFLEKEIGLVSWSYVNNPAGGFWSALLNNWKKWNGYPVYIQIEEDKLCFKISTHFGDTGIVDTNKGRVRNDFFQAVASQAKLQGLKEIKRPSRFGNGNYMTVAIINREDWLGKKDEKLNKEAVLERLNNYKLFFESLTI